MHEDNFLTDDALLTAMEKAAARVDHWNFGHCESILFQRYVKFTIDNLDEFEIPLNIRKLVETNFPPEVAERFIAVKKKLYPTWK